MSLTTQPKDLPIEHNIDAYRGSNLERLFGPWYKNAAGQRTLLDTEGWTGKMMVKAQRTDATALVTATTENGMISTGVRSDEFSDWCIGLLIPANVMATFPDGFVGWYDLKLTSSSGAVVAMYYGTFHVQGDVTQ